MADRKRRLVNLGVEHCERRDLLSGLNLGATHPDASVVLQQILASHATTATVTTSAASDSNPVAPPTVPGQGTPTPREVARESFRASFSGPVYYGPGRFSDQAHIIYTRGTGTSTFFLHGDYNAAFVIPVDKTAPITGTAVMQDKNNNSQAILGLDLTADMSSLDRRGRPTRFTFTADPNIYSGIFFFSTSSGTAKVRYQGNTATMVFNGSVYTNGLTNPLRNSDLVGRGGRLKA